MAASWPNWSEKHHDSTRIAGLLYGGRTIKRSDVHVLQGEREVAAANKSLGRFDLSDIPPAPRARSTNWSRIRHWCQRYFERVCQRQGDGKKQSIVIKASSGLSDDEVERMIKMPKRMPMKTVNWLN